MAKLIKGADVEVEAQPEPELVPVPKPEPRATECESDQECSTDSPPDPILPYSTGLPHRPQNHPIISSNKPYPPHIHEPNLDDYKINQDIYSSSISLDKKYQLGNIISNEITTLKNINKPRIDNFEYILEKEDYFLSKGPKK
jgi:hypothetical protein